MTWETDHHQGSSGAEVVDGLLVSSRGGSGNNGGVGTFAIGSGLDVSDKVLGFLEVDPLLSTELQDEVALGGTSI